MSNVPCKLHCRRRRVVKEEDRFIIEELGVIEDISMPSRISSLNWVRLPMTLFQTGVLIDNNGKLLSKSPLKERSSETSEDNWEISYGISPVKPE